MLSAEQRALHRRALLVGRRHQAIEREVVDIFMSLDADQIFRELGYRSLFRYSVDLLGFSEPIAYAFIAVARKAREIPILREGLERITVNKASRMVSALTIDNAQELIEFAATHTTRELDVEVARIAPRQTLNRVRPVSETEYEWQVRVHRDTELLMQRAESLEAQRGRPFDRASVLHAVLNEYVERHDPVRKAARAKPEAELCTYRVNDGRAPLTAAQKHAVNQRDKGRCQHLDPKGRPCGSDRWIHFHHLVPVALGGTNSPDNLITLCSFHHDLVHQLSLPISEEDEVSGGDGKPRN